MTTENDALSFFSGLSGRLEIVLSEEAKPVSKGMLNVAASGAARVVALHIRWKAFEDDGLRDVTDEEWERVAVRSSSITMCSTEGDAPPVLHRPADGVAFTVRDLARAVEETERQSRSASKWLGGVDVHHVYFEGIEEEGGTYSILWGS